MLTLKYCTEESSYQISFKRINSTIVQINGDFPVKADGFMIYKDQLLLGDYSSYRTIYRTLDHGAQFSDRGDTASADLLTSSPDAENTII